MLLTSLALLLMTGYSGGVHVSVSPGDVQEGITVTLTCGVTSIPAAGDRWEWFENDLSMNQPVQTFTISSFNFSSHGGDYKCSFFNSTSGVTEFSPPVPVCRNVSQTHCLDKADCATGLCPHKCAYGYTEPPSCQNPCTPNKFGLDCTQTCHCLGPQEVCDAVQGVCPSHQCHEDWDGSGCSQRLPKLHDAPSVISSTCTSITVSWDAWDSQHDFGDFPSIWAYRSLSLQTLLVFSVDNSLMTLSDESPNHSQWVLVDTLNHTALKKIYSHTVPVTTIARGVMHRFRVDIFYNASGKMAARSSPGFPSVPVYPCDLPASLSADTPGQVQRGRTVAELRHLVLNMEEVKVKWTLSSILSSSLPTDLRLVYVYRKQRKGLCPPLSPSEPYIRFDMVGGSRGLLLHHLLPGYDYEYMFMVESATFTSIKETLKGEFSTKPNAPISAIEGLMLQNLSATEVTVGWSPPPCEELGGPVSRYEVELSSLKMPTNISFATSLQATLVAMKPSTRYEIRVRYANDIAPGPFSTPFIFETNSDIPPSPSPPLRVRQVFRELHCVGLSWDPGPDNGEKVLSFEIFNLAIANTSKNLTGHWSAPATARQMRVCRLQPNREYVLAVAARGQLALSTTTKTVVYTDHYAPPPPYPLVVVSKTLRTVLVKLRPILSSVVSITYYLIYVAESTPTEQEKVNAGIPMAPKGIVRNEKTSDKKNSLYNQATADGSHFHLSPSKGRTARYTDHAPSQVNNTTIAGTTTSQTLYNILLQPLYNTTPHDMYNATSQTLYNTSQILYNTVQTVYSPTPHITKVSRSESVSGQAAVGADGTYSLATVSMRDVESLETWSRSQANVSVLALKLQTKLRTGTHLQTYARSTKRGHLVGLNIIMTAYLELQSDSISIFLTGRGMLNFQGASRRQTVLRTTLRAHKVRSSSGSNGGSHQDQTEVFRTLVAARRTAGVALTRARRRRQDSVSWNTSRPPGREYIKLEPYELHDEILLIIGSGNVIGGIYNEPLDSRGRYDLYLVSCSEWMSVKKCSASSKSTVLMPNEPFQSGTVGDDWRLANTIAIVVFVLLALLLAMTVLGLWLTNKTPRWYTRKMDMSPSNIASVQALKPGIERHWSDISQLDQKRHIVTGREVLPADQLVGSTNDTGNLPPKAPNITFRDEFDNLPVYFSGTGYHSIYINYSPSAVLGEAYTMRPNNNSSLGTFINASFITGYEQKKRYIAAQSPCSAESALDFWRLIYQEQVHTVVLLSSVVEDGSIRCFQYWPDIAPVYFGPFRIRHVDQKTGFADFAEYMLALSLHGGEIRGGVKRGEEHQVRLLVFTSWCETLLTRDPHPLLELQRRIGTHREPCNETLLVHCESGCGRTAVFIALDILMAAYASKGEVSVYEVVSGMRRERPYMVHTFVQYLLIYIALFEDKHAGDTFLDLQLLTFYHDLLRKHPTTKRTLLYEQFQLLSLVTEADAPPPKAESSGPLVEQPRGFYLGMGDVEVKQLRPDGAEVGDSGLGCHLDGVVFVDGYKRRGQFILAPSPTEASLEQYWHLVYTNDVRSVIVLDLVNATKKPLYWPRKDARHLESFAVHRHGAFNMDNTVTVYTVKVKSRDIPFSHSRQVRVYHCRMWPKIKRLSSQKHHHLVNKKKDDQMIPRTDHYRSLLRVLEQVLAWQQETTHESTPVLLHCSDGFSRSGLMVAIAQMIWRANEEGQVSIYRVVRRLRICCPHAVANYVQYKFLHRLLWVYMRGVEEEVPSDGARPSTYNVTDNDDNTKTSPEVANTTSFADSDSVYMSVVHKSETIIAHESESNQGTSIN